MIIQGNVGIGTTGPTAKLHVVGNCVTGDTLLQIRRRKKKPRSGGVTGGKPDPDEENDMVTGLPRDYLPAIAALKALQAGARNDGIAMTEEIEPASAEGSGEAQYDELLCPIPARSAFSTADAGGSDDPDWEYEYLYERIDSVLPGDEVLSLNESTEALEYARINKLMDMGIKEVYELTTKSGRTIRTTAAHPYLTLIDPSTALGMTKGTVGMTATANI